MLRSCVKKLRKSLLVPFVPLKKDQMEATTLVPEDVMEGHFAVVAIKDEETRRFIVKLEYLTDPMFMELLNQAREEYGFRQKGALAVPCRPQELQNILAAPRENNAKAERMKLEKIALEKLLYMTGAGCPILNVNATGQKHVEKKGSTPSWGTFVTLPFVTSVSTSISYIQF